jgi:hypothetical protein
MRLPWLFVLLTACSTGTNLFNDAGAGGATTGGTPSATTSGSGATTTTSSTTSTTDSTTTSAQGGQGPGNSSSTVGAGGMETTGAGGSSTCAHDVCDQGAALANNCDSCVSSICAQDPYCCNTAWDHICVGYVEGTCQIDCFPIGMGVCGMQYPNHKVCSDDNGQCALDYNATQLSCAALCQGGGGECLGAFNDVQNQTCQIDQGAPLSCTSMQFQTAICICSQGCGNGPPCLILQTCVNGTCI